MEKTNLIVLGVDHSLQLASEMCHPGIMKSYFEAVKPDVICIERDAESYKNNDFYEFTYEIQEIAIPYANNKGLTIYPFDWVPSQNDQKLAWGIKDILTPKLVRDSFLTFSKDALDCDLLFAEQPGVKNRIDSWMDQKRIIGEDDFPRRLSLYRTYMQAMYIKKICKENIGNTVLVVVGYMHKYDIENILANLPYINLQKSSNYNYSIKESEIQLDIKDLLAIASFNLLGIQAEKDINIIWINRILNKLIRNDTVEVQLLKVKFDKLRKLISSEIAYERYLKLLYSVNDEHRFTYTGVKYEDRIDSFYDPFGNLSVKNRIILEMIRECNNLKRVVELEKLKNDLVSSLTPYQREQFHIYFNQFLMNTVMK